MVNIYIFRHQDDFHVIPKEQILGFYSLSFQSLLIVFAEMFSLRMTSSVVKNMSLNTPPDVESQTFDDLFKIIQDSGDVLLKKKLRIDHLQAVSLITHINLTTENKNFKKDYTSIFKIVRVVIVVDVDNDPRPFEMSVSMYTRKTSTHRSLSLSLRRSNLLCPRLTLFTRWLPFQQLHLPLVWICSRYGIVVDLTTIP